MSDWPKDFRIGVAVPPVNGTVEVVLPPIFSPYTGETMTMEPFHRNEDPRSGKPAEVNSNPKHAAGLSKPPLHLVPSTATMLESLVFKLGAKKYGPYNWRSSPVVRSIYLDAAMRHLLALMDGQDIDEESGLPHEAHVRACMAILLDARAAGKLVDDRDTAGPFPNMLKQHTTKV